MKRAKGVMLNSTVGSDCLVSVGGIGSRNLDDHLEEQGSCDRGSRLNEDGTQAKSTGRCECHQQEVPELATYI